MQVLATVAPTVVEYVPAAQLVQVLATVAPTVVEYVPAAQLVQVLAPAVKEYLPAVQLVQVAAAEEVDPSGPYLPAAHKEPEQVEGVVAPTAAEYLPASQSMQTAEPGVRPQRQTTGHFHVHVRNERRRLSCENGCALRIGWACKS